MMIFGEVGFDTWWVWIAGALVLAIFEVLAPGFIFLGFAVGAAITGVLTLFVDWTPTGYLVTFAAASLVVWIVAKFMFGGRGKQVKTFSEDVND